MPYNKSSLLICPHCKKEMILVNVTPPAINVPVMAKEYRCPTREGEGGCGRTKEILIDIRTMEKI